MLILIIKRYQVQGEKNKRATECHFHTKWWGICLDDYFERERPVGKYSRSSYLRDAWGVKETKVEKYCGKNYVIQPEESQMGGSKRVTKCIWTCRESQEAKKGSSYRKRFWAQVDGEWLSAKKRAVDENMNVVTYIAPLRKMIKDSKQMMRTLWQTLVRI